MLVSARSGVALLLLGASISGTVFMAVVAMENFYTIDRLLESQPNPSFRTLVDELGSNPSREFLRYLSSELNRLLFQVWGWADLALIVSVNVLVWRGFGNRLRYAALGMMMLVAILTIILTPPIVEVGRSLDFVPREPSPPQLARFGMLHGAYTVLDVIKLALAVFLSMGLVRTARNRVTTDR